MSFRILVALILVSALFVACDEVGEATFNANLSTEVECLDSVFPFEPSLFAAIRTSNGAMIRMQDGSGVRTRADVFMITLFTVTDHPNSAVCPELEALAGQTVAVGPTECAQAYFRFTRSCNRTFVNPNVVGTVTFEETGLDEGDIIRGSVSGTLADVVIDETTGEPIYFQTDLGTIDGTFEFEVRVGEAYQIFGVPPGPPRKP